MPDTSLLERVSYTKETYYDDLGNECKKDEATNILLVFYDENDNILGTQHGFTDKYDAELAKVHKDIEDLKEWIKTAMQQGVLPPGFDLVKLYKIIDGEYIYSAARSKLAGHKTGVPYCFSIVDGTPRLLSLKDCGYAIYHGEIPNERLLRYNQY